MHSGAINYISGDLSTYINKRESPGIIMILPRSRQQKVIRISPSSLLEAQRHRRTTEPQGLLSRFGSFLVDMWKKISGKSRAGTECFPESEHIISMPIHFKEGPALPSTSFKVNPSEFQAKFKENINFSSTTLPEKKPAAGIAKPSADDNEIYLEDEGFYYVEENSPPQTPPIKKPNANKGFSSITSSAVSEDKFTLSETNGAESDTNVKELIQTPKLVPEPPVVAIPASVPPETNPFLNPPIKETPVLNATGEMNDDIVAKSQEPITSLPFTTTAEITLPPMLGLQAAIPPIPTTNLPVIPNGLPTNVPQPQQTSWSQVNLFGAQTKPKQQEDDDSDLFGRRKVAPRTKRGRR